MLLGIALRAKQGRAPGLRSEVGSMVLSRHPLRGYPWRLAMLACAAFLIVPLAVLTADASKPPVVANVMVGPMVWTIILGFIIMSRESFSYRENKFPVVLPIAAFISVAVGIGNHAHGFLHDHRMSRHRPDVQQVERLYDDMALEARRRHWSQITVFNTLVAGYLNGEMPSVLTCERHGYWIESRSAVSTVLRIPEREALELAAESDFVVLARPQRANLMYQYPFNQEMQSMLPQFEDLCNRDFREVGEYRAYGEEFRLYARR
jgi:hypothetical protein